MLRRMTCAHVPAADGESVAVAAGHQHQQFGVGQFDALRDRQRAAMHGVEAVGGRVTRDAAGTADAGNKGDLVRRAVRWRPAPG